MAHFSLVLKLFVLMISFSLARAQVDRVTSESYLGQKSLSDYSERWQPLVVQDIYRGRLSFGDEIFYQNFFDPYLLGGESEYSSFLKSELNGGLICPNEALSEHFDQIRFSYRLITLSYLLEGQWHMKLISDQMNLKNGCQFDLSSWIKSCRPKTEDMKKFISRLQSFMPRYDEILPADYKKQHWLNEFRNKNFKSYSHYRMNAECKTSCSEEELAIRFKKVCEKDSQIMKLICSEEDEIYGLSQNRDAYYLLGLSTIINSYNKRGEAMGCLRRFSEVMAHKEVRFAVFNQLFPVLQTFLRQKYQERFLQGRVFFFGASKEFEEKGLKDFYVKQQTLQIEKPAELPPEVSDQKKPEVKKDPPKVTEVRKSEEVQKKEPMREIQKPVKSAFLQAAEVRSSGNLVRVEVDMLKLRYDYVFSLNMINSLSQRLKTFMTREALKEMMAYDKLGSKEGPVPLLFIKFMIDMQEHQGLWNIVSVLGDRFYVSNEIDAAFTPKAELVHLVNNESTGRQWQLYIVRQ
jgi:hypothetical protein